MEGELDSKRSELQKLKDEETQLEREYDTSKHELDSLTRTLQDTQIQISQVWFILNKRKPDFDCIWLLSLKAW